MSTTIATAVGRILAPLSLALEDRLHLRRLLDELGWTVEELVETEQVAALLPIGDALEQVAALVEDAEAGAEAGDMVADVVSLARTVFDAVSALSTLDAASLTNLPAPLGDPATWAEIALDLPEYLILRWLRAYHPVAYAALDLTGVLVRTERGDGRPPRVEISFAAATSFVSDPTGQLRDTYGWDGTLDHATLLQRLSALGRALGLPAVRRDLDDATVEGWFGGGAPRGVGRLVLPLFRGRSEDGTAFGEVGIALVPVPRDADGEPSGFMLSSYLGGTAAATIDLGGGISLALSGGAEGSGGLGIVVFPDGVELPSASVTVGAELALTAAPETPWVLIGKAGETRLELAGLEARVKLDGSTSAPELVASVGMAGDGLCLVVEPGDGDSFLGDILGDEPLIVSLDASIGLSSTGGIVISGGLGVDVELAVGKTIGPLRIDSVHVALFIGTDGAELTAALTGAVILGPFTLVVDDIGVIGTLTPRERGDAGGNWGALEAGLAFKPPDGVGIEIDGGAVSGGGYLEISDGEYAGTAALDAFGIGFSAVGLITTAVATGDVPWSLYLGIYVSLGTGIPLGYGFFLTRMGGLLAVHRSLDVDALQSSVKSGAVEAIMFPSDPVGEATLILEQIRDVFPPQRGQFVIGFMAEIGWGVPKLVAVQLGIVLQFPDPITITLLGSVVVILPTEEAPIVELRADLAGTLNPSEGTIAVDASLRDSRVLGITLTGDMAFRAALLDDPTFLLAFGGVHPSFEPPAGFPSLSPIGFAIAAGDWFRLDVGGYFAVSANTLQFGSGGSFYAKACGFTVEGELGFDALLEIAPFGFRVDVDFDVSVEAASVNLLEVHVHATVRGPNPWHVDATAEFKVLGVKTKWHLEAEIGQQKSLPPIESVDVSAEIAAALAESDAWSDATASDALPALMLPLESADEIVVHPAGTLRVQQRLAPLSRTLDHFGAAAISGDTRFEITSATLGGEAATLTSVDDYFAPAQFFTLEEEERIDSPSFETMPCGAEIGDDEVEGGDERSLDLDFEEVVLDPGLESETRRLRVPADELRVAAAVARSPSAQSLATRRRSRSSFAVAKPTWAVVSTETGAANETLTAQANGSWSLAREAAAGATGVVVVPAYEAEQS